MIKVYLVLIAYLVSLLPGKESVAQEINEEKPFAIVIHGGAGSIEKGRFTAEEEAIYIQGLSDALDAGYKILQEGGTSIDAVESAVKSLEDNPIFNAGRGAVLTDRGEAELDASIMDGRTLNAGAVASVKTIKNPISAARLVMEKSPHVLLSASGAESFAERFGFELKDNSYFRVEKQLNRYYKYIEEQKEVNPELNEKGSLDMDIDWKFGTGGCVALDKSGNIAAATSTGGLMFKRFGRIGDSPIIGAGCYANNKTCGISSTGVGEYFIRGVLAYDISARMEYAGESLDQAARKVIANKLTEMGGSGGIIGLDASGNITMVFNTSGMFRGYIDKTGKKSIKLYSE